ncbi:NAD(P)H-binding protein [Actinosynnema sp. NPDC059797]
MVVAVSGACTYVSSAKVRVAMPVTQGRSRSSTRSTTAGISKNFPPRHREADRMIVIAGATGTIGREVVHLLTTRTTPFRALSRTPTLSAPPPPPISPPRSPLPLPPPPSPPPSPSIPPLPPPGSWVRGDHTDPASLDAAFTGASALFLLGPGTDVMPAYDRALLDAAERAGIRRVVKLSVMPVGPITELHRPGEERTRTFPEWTVLRPSLFASNSLQWAPLIAAGEPVPNPMGEVELGVVDPRDVAEVAVAALTGDHHGRTYTLTGPELLSTPAQAAILSRVLNRQVSTVDIPLESLDPNLAKAVAAVRTGEGSITTTHVPDILGRPARDYTTWARDRYPTT